MWTLPLLPQAKQPRRVESVQVDLDGHGFHPARIMRAAGEFNLLINNSSGFANVAFRVEQAGRQLRQQALIAGKLRMRETLTLTAGEYTVTAVNNKTHILQISIR